MSEPVDFAIEGLTVDYRGRGRSVRALSDLSLGLCCGEVTAVVGMSGSGKTTLARALVGGLPRSAVATWTLRRLPSRVSFVQQEAHASLHPLVAVGVQVADVYSGRNDHRVTDRVTDARSAVLRLFDEVGLQPADAYYRRFPHTLSGGEAQRVAFARARAMRADLMIADEPTSHLDLVTQGDVIRLIDRITREERTATLLITHDLGLVAELAQSIVVLKDGRLVESGKVSEVWDRPKDPFTRRLLEAARFKVGCAGV